MFKHLFLYPFKNRQYKILEAINCHKICASTTNTYIIVPAVTCTCEVTYEYIIPFLSPFFCTTWYKNSVFLKDLVLKLHEKIQNNPLILHSGLHPWGKLNIQRKCLKQPRHFFSHKTVNVIILYYVYFSLLTIKV